jgi:hypothetical protein
MPDASEITRRPPQPSDLHLNSQAEALLGSLPPGVAPVALAERFPRILNKIADTWATPTTLMQYLDGLLRDERGNRQGFPFDVAVDIMHLTSHCESLVKDNAGKKETDSKASPWDELHIGGRKPQ